jgi:hypothetical protein
MRWTIYAVLGVMAILAADQGAAVPVYGESPGPFADVAPSEADVDPVRLRIDPAVLGSVVPAGHVAIRFDVAGLLYQPDAATSLPADYADGTRVANAGHFHGYASLVDPADPWLRTNAFLGAPAFSLIENRGDAQTYEAVFSLPEPGLWQLNILAQYDDHTPRTPNHPQLRPAYDVSYLQVIPEPGSLAMVAVAVAPCLARRRARSPTHEP